jgi:hypothetical protein
LVSIDASRSFTLRLSAASEKPAAQAFRQHCGHDKSATNDRLAARQST